MKTILVAAALLAVSSAAMAQDALVNSYSSADAAKAMAAVQAAGYTPGVVASAQAGNLFVRATKDGHSYMVTVTPDGHAYAGPSLGAPIGSAASNPNGPNRVGGAPAGRGPASGGD